MKSLNFDSTNELPNPVLVRASKVGKIVLGWNPKTAANWRSQKIGPLITKEKDSLKSNIRKTIDVQTKIDYQNIYKFHEKEKHFKDSHGELYDILENDNKLKTFIIKALSIRDELKGVSGIIKELGLY